WEHRGVHHAKSAHALHPEAAVEHRFLVLHLGGVRLPRIRTDPARAARMMPPSLMAKPVGQLGRIIGLLRTRPELLLLNTAEAGVQRAGKLDAFGQGGEVRGGTERDR